MWSCSWFIICLLLTLWAVRTEEVTLQWDASSSPFVHYKFYYGLHPGDYDTVIEVGEGLTVSVNGELRVGQIYAFAVTAYNPETGAESVSSNEVLYRVPDVTPPQVVIVAPVEGAIVARRGTVDIQAVASDDEGIVQVDFLINEEARCLARMMPYHCAWDVPAPPDRPYTLLARAWDRSANMGLSTPVHVTSSPPGPVNQETP